jgi:hypothetical protein
VRTVRRPHRPTAGRPDHPETGHPETVDAIAALAVVRNRPTRVTESVKRLLWN